jgi:integrase
MNNIQTNAGTNYLTEADEKKLFTYLKRIKDWQAERDFTLIKLGRITGLRRSELVALNVGDVRDSDRIVIDARIAAKGGIGEVLLPVEMQQIIKRYLRLKRKQGEAVDADAPLFVSRRGSRISNRAVNDLVHKWCIEAGIEPITPHGLRHTKAQRIVRDMKHLDEDQQNRALQLAGKQLRHKSMTATLIYTAPTKEDMAKVAEI